MTTQDKIDGEILAYEILHFVRSRTGSPQTFLAALLFLSQGTESWRILQERMTVDNRGSMPQLHDV